MAILTDASLIWLVNVIVFALWYWSIDRGGAVARQIESSGYKADILFPQKQTKVEGWEKWLSH